MSISSMLKAFFNVFNTRHETFSNAAEVSAAGSALTVNLADKSRLGAAVLVGPRIAFSANKHFIGKKPKDMFIRHPFGRVEARIESIMGFDTHNVAVITLDRPFAAPYAIMDTAGAQPPTSVMMARMTEAGGESKENPVPLFSHAFYKGVMVSDTDEIEMTDPAYGELYSTLASLYHLQTARLDSGAGLFTQDGRLLSILGGGSWLHAHGCRPAELRRIAAQTDLGHSYGKISLVPPSGPR